ncbi:hypothetical protein YQE_04189, partial [Dendroctonus ponderosae]
MNSIQNNFRKAHDAFLANAPFADPAESVEPITESTQRVSINEKKIGEVWSERTFDTDKVKVETVTPIPNAKTTWGTLEINTQTDQRACDQNEEERAEPKHDSRPVTEPVPTADQPQDDTSPSHHARRPPNAFLIFCKKHRPIVRLRFPTTENRGVTKILGEWWALLTVAEKQPYNDLAKEYKDAFLSANPGFRWYKLPAPPLRTLASRPTQVVVAKPTPLAAGPVAKTTPPEFTPGKLADESQLGGLTSLMTNNNFQPPKMPEVDMHSCQIEANNNEDPMLKARTDKTLCSPEVNVVVTVPPKPIKKRIFEQFADEQVRECSRNILDRDLTNQDLLDKVVDGIFATDRDEPKEQRKSDRMCKGKRYERFMVEAKLLGNKRDTRLTQHYRIGKIYEGEAATPTQPPPHFNLENTIKRLAERTNIKIDEEVKVEVERPRTNTDSAESARIDFNLDSRIDALHSLSYDDFVRRKRESKKRKLTNTKFQRTDNERLLTNAPPLVGSKKRKNKRSITHLNKADEEEEDVLPADNELLGLATLAMVAAKRTFDTDKVKVETVTPIPNAKTTWGTLEINTQTDQRACDQNEEERAEPKHDSRPVTEPVPTADQPQDDTSPSHHARRPPNAFLIFCKKHRPIVRLRFPTTENRGVTKILGEWWALLTVAEKQPYNDLAKEYKDAFLSANPGFRWYKLPAPPLRTLASRPTQVVVAKPTPLAAGPVAKTTPPEFTPGKLADESQLGGLTSLMTNNNFQPPKMPEVDMHSCQIEANNNEDPMLKARTDKTLCSPEVNVVVTVPPKPIKKRIFEQFADEQVRECSRNILDRDLTNQDLLDKVVDGIFATDRDEPKEQRKSDRMCKGKRYERFMVEAKLLGNKRDTRLTQHYRIGKIYEGEAATPTQPPPHFNLENTIKRLAERTNIKIDEEVKVEVERPRTNTDSAESARIDFNLDSRIDALHSLSYDDFVRRKRESKKRKLTNTKFQRTDNERLLTNAPPLVGSKKRKNKRSITHLNKADEEEEDVLPADNELLGLATLAMVAASTEKIG